MDEKDNFENNSGEGRILTELVERHYVDPTHESLYAILKCLRGSMVLVPAQMKMSDRDAQNRPDVATLQPGDVIVCEDEVRMKIDILKNSDGTEFFFPVFSNIEQMPVEYAVQFTLLNISFIQCVDYALSMEHVKKMVLNAFTKPVVIQENLLEYVKSWD